MQIFLSFYLYFCVFTENVGILRPNKLIFNYLFSSIVVYIHMIFDGLSGDCLPFAMDESRILARFVEWALLIDKTGLN